MPWLSFFLRCLKKYKFSLTVKVEQEQEEIDIALQVQSLATLKLLKRNERLAIAEIVILAGANKNTLKVQLRELENRGHVQRHGQGHHLE